MPPKKKPTTATEATNTEAGEGETKFAWTTENDRALMILCFGRNPTTDDYAKFVGALPGASYNGVKIRCSKLRMEMKKRYEELGWGLPELTSKAEPKAKTASNTTTKTTSKAKTRADQTGNESAGGGAKKRKAVGEEEDDDVGGDVGAAAEGGGKGKRARVKKGEAEGKGKCKGVKQEDAEVGEVPEEGEGEGHGEGVKEEQVDAE